MDTLKVPGALRHGDRQDYMQWALYAARAVTGAREGWIYILNGCRLELMAGEGMPRQLLADDSTYPGWCATFAEGSFSDDLSGDSRYESLFEKLPVNYPENIFTYPMHRYGKVTAVVMLSELPRRPDEKILKQIEGACERFVRDLEYIDTCKELEGLSYATGEILRYAVDGITPEGAGHVMRVAALATALGKVMDISEHSRRLLWKAATYHDLGKLLMSGREPWEVERFHPREGARFLSAVTHLSDCASLVEKSHERYDGTGWPAGIAGEQLGLEAGVLAIAEDVEEFRHRNQGLSFDGFVAAFYSGPAVSHHPLAVEALTALVNSAQLKKILGG